MAMEIATQAEDQTMDPPEVAVGRLVSWSQVWPGNFSELVDLVFASNASNDEKWRHLSIPLFKISEKESLQP